VKFLTPLWACTETSCSLCGLERISTDSLAKGHFSAVAVPSEEVVYFNTTGNAGMATAGSGDVLTGIITGLLSQKYPARDAALLGVFLHGLAGDLALTGQSEESLVAGDIVQNLGRAFEVLK